VLLYLFNIGQSCTTQQNSKFDIRLTKLAQLVEQIWQTLRELSSLTFDPHELLQLFPKCNYGCRRQFGPA